MKQAPKMQVKCGVDNCKYFQENMCHASALEVNTMGDGKAQTSDGTCCSTFENGSYGGSAAASEMF